LRPPALYLDARQRLIAVVALDVADGQIQSISSIVNPDKLTHLGPVADYQPKKKPNVHSTGNTQQSDGQTLR